MTGESAIDVAVRCSECLGWFSQPSDRSRPQAFGPQATAFCPDCARRRDQRIALNIEAATGSTVGGYNTSDRRVR